MGAISFGDSWFFDKAWRYLTFAPAQPIHPICVAEHHHEPFHLRSISALEEDLKTLDNEFTKLSDVTARGERDDYNPM